MSKIHILPEHIVAKIAAGEVVERPAYAVKELLDNAIDAQAKVIRIDIEEGGLKKIKVTDNGVGMSKDDLRQSYKPHTTSKIHNEEELYNIQSLGFRGEALWSIASISTLTIKSKEAHSDSGNEITIKNGEVEALNTIGMPCGTTVEIANLFQNVPARKKFLRAEKTEFKHIFEMIAGYIIAYPDIHFTVTHNKKEIISISDLVTREQRITLLFGDDLKENLIPLDIHTEYMHMYGFLTKPQAAVHSSLKQHLFVNKRRVSDRILQASIKSAYGTLLEPRIAPAFIFFIDLPAERVDVNVHPRKEQVAFADTALVSHSIYSAVVESLAQKNIAFHDFRWKKGEYGQQAPAYMSLREGGTQSYSGKLLKEAVEPWSPNSNRLLKSTDILQVHNTFIIQQTYEGIIIIDQHAAHERILYEQFLTSFKDQSEKKEMFTPDKPYIIDVGIQGALTLDHYQIQLQKIGIEIEQFGDQQFIIKSFPVIYKDKSIKQLILEVVEDMNNQKVNDIDAQTNKMLSFLACRSAIKAGDRLTKEEAKNLIEKLKESEIQYTCPHGRPVQVTMSLKELYRLFHRT